MGDNERLFAMEPCLGLKGSYLSIYLSIFLYVLTPEGDIRRGFSSGGVNPTTTGLLGKCLTYGDNSSPSSDWKLWNYEKEGA